MKSIKIIALGIGVTALIVGTAIPLVRSLSDTDVDIAGKQPSAVYASDITGISEACSTEAETEKFSGISTECKHEAVKETASEEKPYMICKEDVDSLEITEEEKYFTETTLQKLGNQGIIDRAKSYMDSGFELTDYEYSIKFLDNELEFDGYVFNKGFSFSKEDDEDHEEYLMDVVLATQYEFDQYMLTMEEAFPGEIEMQSEEQDSQNYVIDGGCCTYEITYEPDIEILTQKMIFIYD